MKEINIELDQIRAQIVCIALAMNADPMPSPETVTIALNGIASRLDAIIEKE